MLREAKPRRAWITTTIARMFLMGLFCIVGLSIAGPLISAAAYWIDLAIVGLISLLSWELADRISRFFRKTDS